MLQIKRIIIATLLAGLVAACGVRGPLEPPPGSKQTPEKDHKSVLDNLI